jgi:ankyrin repeat protein
LAQEPLVGQFLAEAEFQRDTAALNLAKLNRVIANFRTDRRSNLVQLLTFRPNRLLETLLADLTITEQQRSRLDPDFGPQHPEMVRISALQKTIDQQIQDAAQGIKAALIEEQASTALLVARLEGRVTSLKELQRATQLNPKNPDIVDLVKAPPQTPAMSPEEAEELERLKKLAAESPDLLRRVHEGVTPLQIAASRGWTAVSGFLLGQGVPIDGVGRYEYGQDRGTPLHRAARTGSVELVTLLLNKGVDPNTRKGNEGTPLHSAARAGRLSAAEKLILAGAYVEARTTKSIPGSAPESEWEAGSDGNTPLHLAAYYGRPIVSELLLRRGANFDATNSQGQPPIWVAAFGRKPDTFRQLLAAGADAKVTLAHVPLPKSTWPKFIPTAWTLLMWASAADEMELVKSLRGRSKRNHRQRTDGASPSCRKGSRPSTLRCRSQSKSSDRWDEITVGHGPTRRSSHHSSASGRNQYDKA